jgi:hypothetical protein
MEVDVMAKRNSRKNGEEEKEAKKENNGKKNDHVSVEILADVDDFVEFLQKQTKEGDKISQEDLQNFFGKFVDSALKGRD